MTDTSTTTAESGQTKTVAHSAGVLAHGLHAIAHHIALYQLPYLRVESYPARVDRAVIEVHVRDLDVEQWLATVHVDEVHREEADVPMTSAMVHRMVRLADSGVVVGLFSVEFGSSAVSA